MGTKTQNRRAARKANKAKRSGKTIAQCVVAVIKANKVVTEKAMTKAMSKKGIMVSSFVLGKVLQRLNRRRVLKKAKSGYKLTGRPLPKDRTLAQKQVAMAKARRSLKKKARKVVKKAKKVKKVKKAKKAKKSKKAKKVKKAKKSMKSMKSRK